MEFVDDGDMAQRLKQHGRFSEAVARFYMAEIVIALDHLHTRHIIYRDLKPENILLSRDGHLKLADFGLAKTNITSVGGVTTRGSKAQTFCGTPYYLAPEIIKGVDYGMAVDWWSTGVVLYEMLTERLPFYSDNRNAIYTHTIKSEVNFPVHVSRQAQSFIRGVLVRRPEDRCGSGSSGVFEIQTHGFFSDVQWELLAQKKIKPPPSRKRDSSRSSSLRALDSLISDHSTMGSESGLTPWTSRPQNSILEDQETPMQLGIGRSQSDQFQLPKANIKNKRGQSSIDSFIKMAEAMGNKLPSSELASWASDL